MPKRASVCATTDTYVPSATLRGAWELRLELRQLAAGEIVGVGSVTTALDAPHDGVTSSVRFAPLVDEQEPIVSEVLAVAGLPV